MKGTRQWLGSATISVSILFLALIPVLQDQGGSPQTPGLQLYGMVDVRHLPPPGDYRGKLKHHFF